MVTETSVSSSRSGRMVSRSALALGAVTGRSPASFEQLGSRAVETPADCMTWHQAPRCPCGSELGALLSVLKEVWLFRSWWGVHQSTAAASYPRCLHWPGGDPQSKLEGIAEGAVAEGEGVVDRQRCQPDGGCPGCTTEQTRLVLLSAAKRPPLVIMKGCQGTQAAGGWRRQP